jgi:diadenosine tetraphosphate (Ap4A) HIT family hydrolase
VSSVPESIDQYYARVLRAVAPDGRLPVDAGDIPNWDIFPFEAEGLQLKPIEPLSEAEEPRAGEDPEACYCAAGASPQGLVWSDDHWQIRVLGASGAPLVMMLAPRAHYDFTDLPPDLAGEMGRLLVALGAAIETLPSVARVHISKWGDGGAHAHIFFFARPTRMPQLRGTCLALWDDFLPAVPQGVLEENTRAVIDRLVATYGGTAADSMR